MDIKQIDAFVIKLTRTELRDLSNAIHDAIFSRKNCLNGNNSKIIENYAKLQEDIHKVFK